MDTTAQAKRPANLFSACVTIVSTTLLSCLSLASETSTSLDVEGFTPVESTLLPVVELAEGVRMPFPGKPVWAGTYETNGVSQHIYQYVDHVNSVGFTATVMAGSMKIRGKPEAILQGYVEGSTQALNAEIVSIESLTVDGALALLVVAYVRDTPFEIRSQTVAIYDRDRVHSWAIQDFPALTGEYAGKVFRENVGRIGMHH